MAGIQIDGVNNKIDFDDDADTSISSASDDTLVIESGGVNVASITAGEFAINEGSADVDFRVESDNIANALFVNGANGYVNIGTNAGLYELNVHDSANAQSYVKFTHSTSGETSDDGYLVGLSGTNALIINYEAGDQIFYTNAIERMRIKSGGNFLIGTTNQSPAEVTTVTGIRLGNNGGTQIGTAGIEVLRLNRNTDDGTLVSLCQFTTVEGTISISGTTTTYGGFTGSHWSRLADNSKPTILRGTLMESLDEMCDWYQAVADVAESKYKADDQEVVDGFKNVGEIKQAAHQVKEPIALPNGKSVGDAVTFISNEVEYTGVYEKEFDVKHVKSKISDTADSKKIYGLFSNWDDADDGLDGDVNDMNIVQVGTYIIRVNKDVTVEAGDLLVSNGDGTAKVQDDDIIRSKTVAKVNSNIKVETYSDGSYTVPCTLHC
jgi:hypothetical protein